MYKGKEQQKGKEDEGEGKKKKSANFNSISNLASRLGQKNSSCTLYFQASTGMQVTREA